MRTHWHSPVDERFVQTVCITCGQDIVRIAGSPDRMEHWRAVRRVARREPRSVVPTTARLDSTEVGWTESELREAYGR